MNWHQSNNFLSFYQLNKWEILIINWLKKHSCISIKMYLWCICQRHNSLCLFGVSIYILLFLGQRGQTFVESCNENLAPCWRCHVTDDNHPSSVTSDSSEVPYGNVVRRPTWWPCCPRCQKLWSCREYGCFGLSLNQLWVYITMSIYF